MREAYRESCDLEDEPSGNRQEDLLPGHWWHRVLIYLGVADDFDYEEQLNPRLEGRVRTIDAQGNVVAECTLEEAISMSSSRHGDTIC